MTKTIVDVEVVDVEKRRVPSKHYVYVIKVIWTDGSSMVIYRRYSRFFDLQTQLLDKFPIEAGSTDPELRIMPFLPGKIFFGRSHIREVALKRRGEISDYCKKLITLPDHISQCEEVLEFFEVEPDDLEPPKEDPRKQKGEKKADKISGPKQLEKYVAVADYGAQEKGEMDLQAGMVVEVTEKSESGWWFVNAEEHQGWVPSTYLQAMNGTSATQNSEHCTQDGHEEKYICIEAFTADSGDEISLAKGAIVDVLQKNMDGWWTVRYQGSEGFAPATYLKKSTDPYALDLVEKSRQSGVQIIGNLSDVSNLLASASSASPRNSAILSSSPPTTAEERGGGGTGDQGRKKEEDGEDRLGEVVGSKRDSLAKMVLKQRSLERGGSLKPPPRQNSVKQLVVSPPPPPTPPSKPSTYLTIADFEDTVGDGISFSAGETVTVLEKTPSGWWFVGRGQDRGWVPESYLQQIDASQTQAGSVAENEDGEEDDFSDDEDEESDEEEKQTQPPSSALASALQTRLKGINGDQKTSTPSVGGPPKPPSKAAKPPSLPGKPQSQPQSDSSQEQKRESTPGIANALKSKFESKPVGFPNKPSEKPGGALNKPSGPPAPPLKPSEKPGPPSLPSKPSGPPVPPSKPGEKPAPPSLPSKPADKPGVPAKQTEKPKPPGLPSKPMEKPSFPALPKKPGSVEGSSAPGGVAGLASSLKSKFESKEQEGPVKPAAKPSKSLSKSFGGEAPTKPSFPHKPADESRPVLGQKPSLPFKVNSTSGDNTKPSFPSKTSSGPPKMPFKPASDSNNDTGGAGRPISSKIHNLAAAFAKQDADPHDSKDTKPKPTLPVKKPSPPAQKPGNRDSAASAGKPRVGNLVSELSSKLHFSGDGGSSKSPEPSPVSKTTPPWSSASQTRNSHKMSEPSPAPAPAPAPQLPNPMHNLLSKPKAEAPSKGVEYEAVADFAAEGEGELCLQCGDVVEVVDQGQEDWWLVRLRNDQGWVPSSYLEPAAQWDD